MCPVNGCTLIFESSTDLDSHVAANLHKIPPPNPRTSNDIARLHLIETVRSTNIQLHKDKSDIKQYNNTSNNDMADSVHNQHFTSLGWALRIRKQHNTISQKTKTFIEDIWTNSQKTRSKLTAEQVQQKMRTQRNDRNGNKLFEPHEYATVNQIKYQFRKLAAKYGVISKQELITEIIEENIDDE